MQDRHGVRFILCSAFVAFNSKQQAEKEKMRARVSMIGKNAKEQL